MARRGDSANDFGYVDDFGVLADEMDGGGQQQPQIPKPTGQLQPGQPGYDAYTDPSVAMPPGATIPPGMRWDPTMANFVPDGTNGSGTGSPISTVTGQHFANGTEVGGGGGGGGGQFSGAPVARDNSMQPISTAAPNYDALNQLLQQMFSAQQARDAENAKYRGDIRTSLLNRLQQASTPKTMDSPEIAAQSKAYRTSSERGLRSQREALAERAHTFGLPSGATDTGIAQAYSGARRDQSAYDASTLGASLKQQVDEMDRLLSIGAGVLSADDVASINAHRDQLSGELSKLSTQQAGNLGQQDINLRSMLGLGGLDLQRLGLTNQNDQFNANFGLNFGNSEWEHNFLDFLLGNKG